MLNEEEGPSNKVCGPSEHLIHPNQVDARQKSKRKPGGAQLWHDAVFPNGRRVLYVHSWPAYTSPLVLAMDSKEGLGAF